MKNQSFILVTAIIAVTSSSSVAQTDNWEAPFTALGQPDLQGVWGNNTITPVERPERFGERLFLTQEEQILLERRMRPKRMVSSGRVMVWLS